MKNDPIEAALARLDEVPLHTEDGRKQLSKALASKWSLVAAKAAKIAGNAEWTELAGDLAAALDRLLKAGAAADKGCSAKIAVARGLIELECDGADLFLRGMKCVQMEGSWGPPVDAAAELRSICAMGLAGSTYHFKLREMVNLLVDREWVVRAGAVRAIATVGSEAAALLLRFKVMTGDEEAEVIADCFSGLITVDGAEGVALTASFAATGEDATQEAAILALGASRRADAVDALTELFERTAKPPLRQCILLSLATSRTQPAIDFLLAVIRDGGAAAAAVAVSALAVYRGDEKMRASVDQAARSRSDSAASRAFLADFSAND